MSELKPCPFCGAADELDLVNEMGAEATASRAVYVAGCKKCHLMLDCWMDIDEWNRRATPPEVAEVLRLHRIHEEARVRRVDEINVEAWAARICEVGKLMRQALIQLAKAYPEVS